MWLVTGMRTQEARRFDLAYTSIVPGVLSVTF